MLSKDTSLSFANLNYQLKLFFNIQLRNLIFFETLFVTMKKMKRNTIATADKKFDGCYFDISENSKRLVRATLKTYDKTGTYVLLSVFKKTTEDAEIECVQRLSLSSEEFSKLLKSGKSICVQTCENSDSVENKGNP